MKPPKEPPPLPGRERPSGIPTPPFTTLPHRPSHARELQPGEGLLFTELEALQKNVGTMVETMNGLAQGTHETLTELGSSVTQALQLMMWATLLIVLSLVGSIVLVVYTVRSEHQAATEHRAFESNEGAAHRAHEQLENGKLREELWGVISLLSQRVCETHAQRAPEPASPN